MNDPCNLRRFVEAQDPIYGAILDELKSGLGHPILGARLRDCTQLVNDVEGRTARQIFGHPDDLKFRSSMTLFANVAQDDHIFEAALAKYSEGKHDPLTLRVLG